MLQFAGDQDRFRTLQKCKEKPVGGKRKREAYQLFSAFDQRVGRGIFVFFLLKVK